MKKKILLLGLLGFVIAVGVAGWHIMQVVSYRVVEIPRVEIAGVADGDYHGSVRAGLYTFSVAANVKGGRLTAVGLEDFPADPMSDKARDMPRRILEAQSLQVEAVTGATCSSNAILMALAKALGG